jgi:hypothetical protein
MKIVKWMALLIILAVIGCGLVQREDGRIVHESQVVPGEVVVALAPEDLVEDAIKGLSPIASLVPYGSAATAMLLTGLGFYRKYKPQVKALKELVSAVDTMPQKLRANFKKEMRRSATSKTKHVIKKIKT